ncbi:MAG: DUF2927 domain-containing protein [Actinobacteria bacterium]|nr:DUF2927 domain-containing protein [Actinomycetota bacterium]
MRALRFILSSILLIAVAVVTVYGCGVAWQSLIVSLGGADRSNDRQPTEAVALSSLPQYTQKVAGKAWFRRYFARMVFDDGNGAGSYTGILTRWDKQRVRIDILNSGGPGMHRYVVMLVRRLNRMQQAVTFVVVDGRAEVTIEYLSHDAYRRTIGDDNTVGNCATRFYQGPPGLISAVIKVDAGVEATSVDRKATIVHELTHALGFSGHFRKRSDQRRSVLYYASTLTNWSQADAAAIRIMYSSSMRNGMNVHGVDRALRRFAAGRR